MGRAAERAAAATAGCSSRRWSLGANADDIVPFRRRQSNDLLRLRRLGKVRFEARTSRCVKIRFLTHACERNETEPFDRSVRT